jgi:bacillopeptidase F
MEEVTVLVPMNRRPTETARRIIRHAALILAVMALLVSPAGVDLPASASGPAGDDVSSLPAMPDPDALPPEATAKIEPTLLRQLLAMVPHPPDSAATAVSDGPITYLVYLEDEAPLSGLSLPRDCQARRHAVVARLQERAERSQRRVTDLLRERIASGLVARYRSYWIANVLVVEGGLEVALALALLPEVVAIEPNRIIQLTLPEVEEITQAAAKCTSFRDIAWGVDTIDADRVWAELGVTGQGIVVANMDSGVDWTHPDLQAKYRGYNPRRPAASNHDYNWFDFTGTYPDAPGPSRPIHHAYLPLVAGGRAPSTTTTSPPSGVSSYPHWQIKDHGTHVMGIMVGSSPDGDTIVGVAPGAQWIAVKAFDDGGKATEEAILAGFQWMLAPTDLNGENPDPSKSPDVLCCSWGDDGTVTTYQAATAALRAAGIITVFSAGNRGPGVSTIDAPASYTNTLAIGATDSGDTVATFSSRGPSPWNQIKPDVVAPGVSIVSTIPGGGYGTLSGTSFSAPHAAGAIALMLQADRQALGLPTLTITTTEGILRETALDLGDPGPDNTYGYGRIDAYAAVQAVQGIDRLILPMVFRWAPMTAP